MEERSSTEVLDVESSPFAAEDYVQMACALRRSADMRVRYPDGRSGGIVVNKGELWHAWDNLGGGSEAFLRMIGMAQVTRIRSLSPSDTTTRTVSESCQKLLLQAVIDQDARGSSVPALPQPMAAPQSDRAIAAQFSDSELTRPNWPAPRRGATVQTEPDVDAPTGRSQTERPVEMSVAAPPKPRSISTFLRQPSVVQRGMAALFGAILVGSVGQILASPAGGQPSTDDVAPPPQAPATAFAPTMRGATNTKALPSSTEAAAKRGFAQQPAEMVFTVSALRPVDAADAVDRNPSLPVLTRVHDVSASGLDESAATRHVMSATSQFATCYDWAATRTLAQRGVGNLAVAVNFDKDGSVLSASARGGKLQGLNTCVAQVAERVGQLLSLPAGPGRLAWTVGYTTSEPTTPDDLGSERH